MVVRGARQVRKSFLLERFAKENFKTAVIINFEYDFEFYEDFETLDPVYVVNQIYLKQALEHLIDAHLFTKVRATSGAVTPLELNASDSDFNSGLITEQFVGQELRVYVDPYDLRRLYYWFNDAKNASAEIDYLLEIGKQIIPVEVKASHRGRLKSLRYFMDKYKAPLGIRISANPLSFEEGILSVPFYAVSEINRLLASVI